MKWQFGPAVAIGVVILASVGHAQQLSEKKVLTLAVAKKLADVARAEAAKNKVAVVIAIIDDGRNLVYLERMDNAIVGGIDAAILKARTAVSFRQPTKLWEQLVREKGRADLLKLPDFIPLEGGIPLTVEGEVIGGIGVSGASSSHDDGIVAEAGSKGLAAYERGNASSE